MPVDKDSLICVPAAAARIVPRGATFDRKCKTCGTNVVTSPTGVQRLIANPRLSICCVSCFFVNFTGSHDEPVKWAADAETMLAELNSAIPNPWRQRN